MRLGELEGRKSYQQAQMHLYEWIVIRMLPVMHLLPSEVGSSGVRDSLKVGMRQSCVGKNEVQERHEGGTTPSDEVSSEIRDRLE